MSYSTIKAIFPGERVEDIEELRNSWGTAPLVWDAMFKKYVPPKREYDTWVLDSGGRLWSLYDREDIPLHQRVILALTFDRAYVLKKDYARAAADIRRFMEDFPPAAGHVNHWPHIAALLESNPEFPAIGFMWTSVSEDPWDGPWNEAKEQHDPLEWAKCWSLYDEVDDASSAPADGVSHLDRKPLSPPATFGEME